MGKKSILSFLIFTVFIAVPYQKAFSISFDDFGAVWGEYFAEALNEFLDLGIIDEDDLEEFSDSFPATVDVEGATADIKVFPNSLFFGAWPEGFRSPKLPLIVTNDGVEPAIIRKVEISGDHEDDFRIESEDCEGETLGNADTCDIRISFKPTDTGDRKADLVIHWFSASQGFQEVTVNLYGIGLPGDPTDICDFDDLINGECGGFDFPSPFSSGEPTIADSQKLEKSSVNDIDASGGCNFGSAIVVPIYLLIPFILLFRRIRG
ncbi:MAG: hypothetical protein GXO22_02530 [Aquificae bacterium]|nr:hypothetical protein [Aquificota bacterium]